MLRLLDRFFFFKQKTAYEMRISDWSSDVCSSDLNRVRDASPSQIHGTLTAPGTVLILNQNGVLFGGTSVVNVRNLIASSANILDSDFLDTNRGIYSQLSGANYLPSFRDAGGAITIEAGAQIKSEEHTSELQSLMRTSYAVFCLKKKKDKNKDN